MWPNDVQISKLIPLFNNEGSKIAYYLKLTTGEYTIINNDKKNPTVIEYGEGGNQYIDDIVEYNDNYHIVFNNSFDLYDANDINTYSLNSNGDSDYYNSYPDLRQANNMLSTEIAQAKDYLLHKGANNSSIEDHIVLMGDGDYGFINWDDMPSGSYSSGNLPYGSTSWAVTGDYNDIAEDHCGAVFVTNLALYFAHRGYNDLKIEDSKRDTFVAIHEIVGDGPVMTVAGKAKTFFSNSGYSLNYSSVSSFNGIKSAISNNRPLGILLADGIVSWHWIMAVGWRQYNSGGNYMRIVDGWNDTTNRFYKINSGSVWWSATEYWVK